jgi:triosephosphate isomerase
MSSRRPLVAGNWKMHGNRADTAALVGAIRTGVGTVSVAEVAVCPPFILIPLVAEKLSGSPVFWGGQNLSTHKFGAYTGEISGTMLKDFGCTYVIVGHSERRTLYGESESLVAEKYAAAQAADLIPILCVGETLQERDSNLTEDVVARQLDAVLSAHGVRSFKKAVIAYEPVWAIGTGKTATPAQAQEVHRFIRGRLAVMDKSVADSVRILYGGSMKASSASELLAQPDIDGGLVGGASLQADEFLAISRAAK